jgi:hypothetical protein
MAIVRKASASRTPPKTIETLLAEIEALNDLVVKKIEYGSEAANERYTAELSPRLEHARKLAAQGSLLARNALEDAVVIFREFSITANARVIG